MRCFASGHRCQQAQAAFLTSGPVTDRVPVTTPDSSGELVLNQATMTWSASNDLGVSFVSDPSPAASAFASIGAVKNGVFA